MLAAHVAPLDEFVTCRLCDAELWLPTHMYWYAAGVVVCRVHSNAQMTAHLRRTFTNLDALTPLEMITELRAWHAARPRSRPVVGAVGTAFSRKRKR